MGILYNSMEVQNKLGSNSLVLVFKQESMEYKMKNVFGLRWNCRDREAEVFQVSNDAAAVAQRWLEDKQPEETTNTDCLVKERENVHLGIKVGANITVTGVPGQEGAEGGPRFEVPARGKDAEYRLCLSVTPKVEIVGY
ncbi:hypothetical protein Tco_0808812 [Tanacetum coccineum]